VQNRSAADTPDRDAAPVIRGAAAPRTERADEGAALVADP
jgi:hypothetical protein